MYYHYMPYEVNIAGHHNVSKKLVELGSPPLVFLEGATAKRVAGRSTYVKARVTIWIVSTGAPSYHILLSIHNLLGLCYL